MTSKASYQYKKIKVLRNNQSHISSHMIQVNLCQKYLFTRQLTHNMTTDCSINYKFSTRKQQGENMSRTCFAHKLFWMSKQKSWELDPSKYSLGIAELDKILSWFIFLNSNFIKTPNIDGSRKLQKSICSSNIDKSFMKHAIEQYLQKRHFKHVGVQLLIHAMLIRL